MYARLLAVACLLCGSVRSEPLPGSKAEVGVFLKAGASASERSLRAMRAELAEIMGPAGIELQWVEPGVSNSAERMISVELKGACQVSSGAREAFRNGTALASTAVQDGQVLPFSWIDCGAVERFLGKSLDRFERGERAEIYGKALARLLAHEFFHVIAATEEHTSGGVSKTAFTVADLLAERISFQPEAIAMLHAEPGMPVLASAAAAAAESASGLEYSFGDSVAAEGFLGR